MKVEGILSGHCLIGVFISESIELFIKLVRFGWRGSLSDLFFKQ